MVHTAITQASGSYRVGLPFREQESGEAHFSILTSFRLVRLFTILESHLLELLLKLINYSCISYPTRASYSSQVDEFRNPMINELKTRPCLKPVFEITSNTDANFLNLHINKATKTRGDKQLFNHIFYET